MTSILEAFRRRFTQAQTIPAGIYHYQSPPHAEFPYRMHLRVESSGDGVLIIDASTILHLNQTATEYAFHLVNETPAEKVVRDISSRYSISKEHIRADFQDFKERIFALIDIPDLDPVTFLEFDRDIPYSGEISAPYRLDCALTYRLPPGSDQEAAPAKRVDRELTTEEWGSIIDKAWEVGIPHIVFTGGEPTLRDDLPKLISHAENNGQVTGLLTDGIRLENPDYLETLLQTGLDHIMVVLNPQDERIWKALEITLPQDIFTTIHLTVTQENKELIPEILNKLKTMDVNAISLSDNSPELDETLQEIRELVADHHVPLVWDLPVPYSSRNPITLETMDDQVPDGAGRTWLYVEPDGDVLPAQGINHVLGNFLRNSWDMIWG